MLILNKLETRTLLQYGIEDSLIKPTTDKRLSVPSFFQHAIYDNRLFITFILHIYNFPGLYIQISILQPHR